MVGGRLRRKIPRLHAAAAQPAACTRRQDFDRARAHGLPEPVHDAVRLRDVQDRGRSDQMAYRPSKSAAAVGEIRAAGDKSDDASVTMASRQPLNLIARRVSLDSLLEG